MTFFCFWLLLGLWVFAIQPTVHSGGSQQGDGLWLWLLSLVTGDRQRKTWHMTHYSSWHMNHESWKLFYRCYYPNTLRDQYLLKAGFFSTYKKRLRWNRILLIEVCYTSRPVLRRVFACYCFKWIVIMHTIIAVHVINKENALFASKLPKKIKYIDRIIFNHTLPI